MVKRISALNQTYQKGMFGREGKTGVTLSEIKNLILYQYNTGSLCLQLRHCLYKYYS